VAILLGMMCGASTACGAAQTTPTPGSSAVVARVGASVITQAAFDTRLKSTLTAIHQGGGPSGNAAMEAQVRAAVVRSLILDTIIAQEAQSRGIAATSRDVQSQIDADAKSVGGLSTLESQLASAGGSLAQLQDEVRSQINEERLENIFAQQRAQEVEQRLAAGEAFATVAQEMSDDSGTNAKGGDLGALSASDLTTYDPAFAAAVKALAPAQYTTTPVRDAGGYDIIQLYAIGSNGQGQQTWSVRHILVAAPVPYTVSNRPAWFGEALFATVAQLCTTGKVRVYLKDAGADPCKGAPVLTPSPAP
jgi:parvulin-like peptidyl-prolyl isomerase